MACRWSCWLVVPVVLALGGGCGQPVAAPTPSSTPVLNAPQPTVASASVANPVSKVEKPPELPRLWMTPTMLTLAAGDPGAQIVVEGQGSRGGRRDVTGAAAWTVEPEGIITIDAGGYVRPLGPGRATLRAVLAGAQAATAVVTVAAATERPWSFGTDIVPILTRAGCNTGGCHGRADGQNGFHLSFFGYDHAGDYRAIARESAQRRIALIDPDQSLLLGKASGRVPHGGGMRLAVDSSEYQTLRDWIGAGAPESRGPTHGKLTGLKVEPADLRLDEPGPRQLRIVATYQDGHDRDVTRLAAYRVNDDSAAAIGPDGKATLLRRAETDLVVRYQSQVVSGRLATLINPDLVFDFAKLPRRNFIDVELFKRLEALRVPPSPPATDAAFLRRVSLDLTGEQPLPEEVRKFLADGDPEKRSKLVDRLLAKHEFVLFWRIKLGDMLQISSTRLGNGASRYQTWLDEQLTKNTPWDAIVTTLLTAQGDPTGYDGGPANYAAEDPDPKAQAEQTAQRFLALRVRCAQCHDHPFDVWTQDDYFGLAACFAKVERTAGGPGMMGKAVIKINPMGKIEHLRTKQPVTPRLLDGKPVEVAESDDPRQALAAWMTAPDNPFFARAMANWVWAQFFGKGLADPPDDLSRSNPPVHPELLDALGRHFVAKKYDLRALVRAVATSEAYGLSSATVPGNARDVRLFSHQIPRPLTAHQMADALAQATDVPNRYPGVNPTRSAIRVPDPSTASQVLDTFGRCPRTNGCASVAVPALSLRQALLLIGGDVIESKVSSLNGYLANLLDLKPEPEEIVENLYLRTLCRPATAEEVSRWSAELKQAPSQREAAEDLFWALLNSREFAFNH